MELNEYDIFEYSESVHSLGTVLAGAVQVLPEKGVPLPEKEAVPLLPEKEEEASPTEKEKSTSAHIADDGKPRFVKHINKTRTMSGRQKWDWAFERIMQVGGAGGRQDAIKVSSQ